MPARLPTAPAPRRHAFIVRVPDRLWTRFRTVTRNRPFSLNTMFVSAIARFVAARGKHFDLGEETCVCVACLNTAPAPGEDEAER